jgi:hypothetical protein
LPAPSTRFWVTVALVGMRSASTTTAPADAIVPLAPDGSVDKPRRDEKPNSPWWTIVPSALGVNDPTETRKFDDCEEPEPSIPSATCMVRAGGVGCSAVPGLR